MKFKQHFLIGITFALAWLAHGQTLEVLHSFNGLDGSDPFAGLIQASDGNFYGTTSSGGSNQFGFGNGTVFKITPAGEFTSLVSLGFGNGSQSFSSLLQDSIDDFYGTASSFFSDAGTIFKMTTNGLVTALVQTGGPHAILPSTETFPDGWTNTFLPFGTILEAKDGDFYGSAYFGDAEGGGAIFRMNREGDLTLLYSFVSLAARFRTSSISEKQNQTTAKSRTYADLGWETAVSEVLEDLGGFDKGFDDFPNGQ